jgi:flagellar hook-associated protein 2
MSPDFAHGGPAAHPINTVRGATASAHRRFFVTETSMAGISSTVGLASGIDSKSIIDQLIALEQRPKLNLLTRMDAENKKKAAYTDLQIRLTSVRLFGTQIKKPQTFRAADVQSSDEGVVTGSAGVGAAAGSYQMSVARLVTAQQSVSKGFADFDKTAVGAGTITLEMGGGDLNEPTNLDDLNGGAGVRRGAFRITDRSGHVAIIDTSDAVTLDDVVQKINTSLDVSVKAEIKDDALVLTDQTGAVLNDFRIAEVGDGHTAEDLGIKQNAALPTITGTSLGGLKPTTSLDKLNDGRGISFATTGADLSITTSGGTTAVTLTGSKTIGDVLTKINTAMGSNGHADINADGKGISIVDAGGATASVAAVGTSTAANDLGLTGVTSTAGTLTGRSITAGVNSTLISSLRGGQGLDLGVIRIVDRAGVASDIDLTGATTVNQILDRINAAGANVLAEVKPGANGITLTDKTDKLGQLQISDTSGTAAAQLGIVGNFAADTAHASISGANLQKAWFTRDTQLSQLNGGKGVPEGKFKVTDSAGKTRTFTTDPATTPDIGSLIDKINAGTTLGVTASINANGDGLLLTDTALGGQKLKVEEVDNGTIAKALNIAGTATTTTIDGSWEKTITVSATDKLADVQKKITDLGWGLSAAIINDGSKDAPYRLSLTSTNTGRDGRVVFSSGGTNLGERVLVQAQDAAVFVGSADGTGQPLLVTASSNQISGAIRGVTLNLNGVSESPVTVNIARNVDNVVTAASKFVEDFNGIITQLQTYTKFDSATNTRGELLGDSAAGNVESELYGMLNTVGNTSGKYRIPADVGFKVGEGGALQFDEEKFRAAYADDPEAVTTLFTRGGAAIDEDFQLTALRNGRGLRTNAAGTSDFRIDTRGGTGFEVDVSDLSTMGQVIDAINNATGNAGKIVATVNTTGTGIDLADKTTQVGTKKFVVSTLNGSIAASDLGLLVTSANGKIAGKRLTDANAGNDGGIGALVEKRVNRLIDPTNGVVSRASKNVDNRNDDFQERIDSIDKLVASKRARLEKQFANMETALSSLQGQQSALNSFTPVSPN